MGDRQSFGKKRETNMKTTMSRLAGSLSAEEFNQFILHEVTNSEAFGTVEIINRFKDGSIEVSGNAFLGAALSLGFRPVKVAVYRDGVIYRVSPDTLYASDSGIGSWFGGDSNIYASEVALIKRFLEAEGNKIGQLEEQLDKLGISFS